VLTAEWTLEDFFGYLDTWSATRRYLTVHGDHPLTLIRPALAEAWGGAPSRQVLWPLFMRAGYLPKG